MILGILFGAGSPALAQVRNDQPAVAARASVAWSASVPRGTRATADLAPASAEAVLTRFFAAHSALRYDEALLYARELVLAAPGHEIAHYNLACVLARRGETAAALDAIDRAVECGWRSEAHAALDPDLTILRGHPRFSVALERMRELERAEVLVAGPLRHEDVAVVAADLAARAPAVLERYHVPGAAVVVIRSGRAVHHAGFGQATLRPDVAADADTAWAFSAPIDLLAVVAAAQLDQADQLDLDDLLAAAEERMSTAMLTARTVPRSGRTRTIGLRGQRGSERRLSSRFQPPGGHAARDVLMAGLDFAGSGFVTHCRRNVVNRLDLRATRIGPSRLERERLGDGHTAMGTPLSPPEAVPAGAVVTTARDLGTLVAALASTDLAPLGDGVGPTVARVMIGLDGLGLALRERTTGAGSCVELLESTAGVTLLLRWFPETGDGVVVIANLADGDRAVEHLAGVAVGGSP